MVRVNDVNDWHEVVRAVQSMLGSYVGSWFVGYHVHHDDESVDFFCNRGGCEALIKGAGAVVEDTEHEAAKRGIRCWAFLCPTCADGEKA